MENSAFDIHGHRGCRGLMPENTIPAFICAIELGVTTLEMDVVISGDKKVVVSHEPWMSHSLCLKPDGSSIRAEEEKSLNLYEMKYDEIKKYDCGSKGNEKFPGQKKIPAYKPLLNEVIESAESLVIEKNSKQIYYNIETKCSPEGDNVFHPSPEIFTGLLVQVINEKKIADRCMIQSFDLRTLQYLHNYFPDFKTVMLVDNTASPSENIDRLGFTPYAYSPRHSLINKSLVQFCRHENMKLIPWTVNELPDMKALVQLGVDGIITDYPDRLIALFNTLNTKKGEW